MAKPRVAILDDYQHVALTSADWTLGDRVDITVFDDHIRDEDALVERLSPFEVVVAMRERTAFPESLLKRLPALKLLITTGPFNAVIDVAAANRAGITVSGTGGAGAATPELTWALILGITRGIAAEDAGVRAGRWQLGNRAGADGLDAWHSGSWPDGTPYRPLRPRVRHEGARLEPEPHERGRREGWRRIRQQGRALRSQRHRHRAAQAQRPHAGIGGSG